jgi:alanine dehydrogenase
VRILTASDVVRSLPMDRCLAAVRQALAAPAAIPERTRLALPAGDVLFMPGHLPGVALGLKVVGVFPANPARGLAATMAVVLLVEADSGAPVALLDGTALTALRTGAATGVATDRLAAPDASVLAVLGAGGIAPAQIAGVRAVRAVREVRLWNRTRARAETLAAGLEGVRATVCATAAEAVAGADVVVCCTSATAPVLRGAWLKPGAHVNAVGGYRPDMVEVDEACVRRASVVATDNPAEAPHCGDLAGRVAPGRIEPLATASRPPDADITLYKGLGTAALDLAAAAVALAAAAGVEVDLSR